LNTVLFEDVLVIKKVLFFKPKLEKRGPGKYNPSGLDRIVGGVIISPFEERRHN